MTDKFHNHLLFAVIIASGLSVYFSVAFDLEFRVASLLLILGCAASGSTVGWLARRRFWITGIVTAFLRCALFVGLRGAVT